MEPVTVTTVKFEAADGTVLEGDLLSPADSSGAAVVCHPHPLYGGARDDAVVAALCRGLVAAGRRVLRFDFRGAGSSTGIHGGGEPERSDLLGAIDAVDSGTAPVIIAGYSFGADVALSVADPRADGWLVVAPPLAVFGETVPLAAGDPRPVRILHPAHDQFNPPDNLSETVQGWTNCTVEVIESADHFLTGAHHQVTRRAEALAR